MLAQNGFRHFFSESGIKGYAKTFIMQAVVVFVIAWPWLNLSLIKYGMYKRILFEGTMRGREGGIFQYLYFLKASVIDLKYVTLLAIIPIYQNFRDKKNRHLILSIAAIIITASIIISNRQLRYAVQFIPFLYLFAVMGLILVARRIRLPILLITIVLLGFFAFEDYKHMVESTDLVGHVDTQLEKFMAQAHNPAYFMNIKGHGNHSASRSVHGYQHKYTPDLFNFKVIKSSPNYYDPSTMNRFVEILYWHGTGLDQHPEAVVNKLVEISKQVNTYVILFKFEHTEDHIISSLWPLLKDQGFSYKEMDYYVVLYKEL